MHLYSKIIYTFKKSESTTICDISNDVKEELRKFRFSKSQNAALILKVDREKKLIVVDELIEDVTVLKNLFIDLGFFDDDFSCSYSWRTCKNNFLHTNLDTLFIATKCYMTTNECHFRWFSFISLLAIPRSICR